MYTKNKALLLLSTLMFIFLWGCSSQLVVKKVDPDDDGNPLHGVPFYLNKPYILVTKYFVEDVGKPDKSKIPIYTTEEITYLPDPEHFYVATYIPAPFASSDFTLKYEAGKQGSVISEVSFASTPPSPEKLAEAATKAFKPMSAPSEWPQFLTDLLVPGKRLRVEIELLPLTAPQSIP